MAKVFSIHRMLFLFGAMLWVSCEEKIDWKGSVSDPFLAVEASVDNSFSQHEVILTKTADYYSKATPDSISGATVTVTESDNIYVYTEKSPGKYVSDNFFKGVSGKEYRLDIHLPVELNGHSSFSATETMPYPLIVHDFDFFCIDLPLNNTDDYDYDLHAEERIIALRVSCEEPEGLSYYRISAVVGNEFARKSVTENYTEHYATDDQGIDGSNEIVFELNEPINGGDSLFVGIHSITRSEMRYLSDLKEEIDRSDPLGMTNDPANVEGNISNGAIGCFRLASTVYLADTVEDVSFSMQ